MTAEEREQLEAPDAPQVRQLLDLTSTEGRRLLGEGWGLVVWLVEGREAIMLEVVDGDDLIGVELNRGEVRALHRTLGDWLVDVRATELARAEVERGRS